MNSSQKSVLKRRYTWDVWEAKALHIKCPRERKFPQEHFSNYMRFECIGEQHGFIKIFIKKY